MAGSINKVILIGNVGRDPEIRATQGGSKIANLSIATSESWKDKNSGERKEKTEWHRVVIFNDKLSDVVEKYVHKGSKVYVEGSLQTRKWTDKEGNDRYSTEVVIQAFGGRMEMLDSKGDRSEPESYGGNKELPPAEGAHGGGGAGGLDDEIPFAPLRDLP